MNEFSFKNIENFDNHISKSIRGFDLLDDIICNISSFFAKNNSNIIDLGCTSGRLINKLAELYPQSNCIGFDLIDDNFIKGKADLVKCDITDKEFHLEKSNLILSVFTMQFLSFTDREIIFKKIYNGLEKNGAFIICEKEIAKDGMIQEIFIFSNYDYKKNQFSPNEILSKEIDLRKLMNPLSEGENYKILNKLGFRNVTLFFQSLNFKGYLCIK